LNVGPKPLVLCYHAISDSLDNGLAVRPEKLREQMRELAGRGYAGTTFAELERARAEGRDTAKTVAVTFDDGYRSMIEASEILDEVGFAATVFVLPTMIGSGKPMSWPGIEQWATGPQSDEMLPLDWDEIERLRNAGWEIGAHTLTHPTLTKVSPEQLADELGTAREQLVARLGSCDSVAYPYGLANRRVVKAAADAGYVHGATLTGFHAFDTPLRRPRIGIFLHDNQRRFNAKIAGWTRALRTIPGVFTSAADT
jgi:peptidoglycan/xylan/chitin deacetylase (PgdA/CDA1 family)